MGEIVCREFEERDWPDMVRFYTQFYKPDYIFTNRKFFDWNFYSPLRADDRCGQKLMLDGDRIIGIMGSLPWPMQIDGERKRAQYNINLFLDEAYRGHRMGQRLLERVSSGYSYSLSNGFNARTLSMYERLGKVVHWAMRRLVKCLDARRAEEVMMSSLRLDQIPESTRLDIVAKMKRSAGTPPAATSLTFEPVQKFDSSWNEAWEQLRKRYGLTTWRSAEFLNWRYADYPYPIYDCFLVRESGRIAGLVVLRTESPQFGSVVRIVDLVCAEGALRGALSLIEAFSRERSAVFVDFIFQGPSVVGALGESGFHELSDPVTNTQALPMDLNPIRHRNQILMLVTFVGPQAQTSADIGRGEFFVVKGDGDQDRAN